jgi:hypothetical protein
MAISLVGIALAVGIILFLVAVIAGVAILLFSRQSDRPDSERPDRDG